MSNLKNNFASKLTSVIKTEKNGRYIYTASFADGRVPAVIRTSNRDYVSVTQITCGDNRTDFLFSAKPTASLGKNEQHRVVAVVQVVNPPAPKPEGLDIMMDKSPFTSEPTDKELAAYQPKIVTDAITNALVRKLGEALQTTSDLLEGYGHYVKYGKDLVKEANAWVELDEQARKDALALDEQHRLEHSGDGDCDRHPLG